MNSLLFRALTAMLIASTLLPQIDAYSLNGSDEYHDFDYAVNEEYEYESPSDSPIATTYCHEFPSCYENPADACPTCVMRNAVVTATTQLPFNSASYTEFVCELCSLHSIPFGMFNFNGQIEILRLANSGIGELTVKDLLGAHSLHTLDLSGNHLHELIDNQFAGATSLRTLRLSGNRIETVSVRAFETTEELESLYLDGNAIREITFSGLPGRLEHLHLQHNRLEGVAVLHGAISTLNLGYNRLNSIKFDVDANTSAITVLNVTHNNLSRLGPLVARLFELRVLDISANPIGDINLAAFASLRQLEHLFIRNIGLRASHLDFGLFSSQTSSLRTLDISNNRLGRINLHTLMHLNELLHLNIAGNRLTTLDIDDLVDIWLNQLHRIELTDNEFNCTYLSVLTNRFGAHTFHVDASRAVYNASNVLNMACVTAAEMTPDTWLVTIGHGFLTLLSLVVLALAALCCYLVRQYRRVAGARWRDAPQRDALVVMNVETVDQ